MYILLFLALFFPLSACSKDDVMKAFKPGYDLNGHPYAETPPENIKINPSRKQRYEITIDFRDAPGRFTYFRGTELYYAWNCKYMTSSRYRLS